MSLILLAVKKKKQNKKHFGMNAPGIILNNTYLEANFEAWTKKIFTAELKIG